LTDIQVKCRALLIGRLWLRSTRKGSATVTGVKTGWDQGESTACRKDTDGVRVLIRICDGHGPHSAPWERRKAPDIQTARVQYSVHNGGSGE